MTPFVWRAAWLMLLVSFAPPTLAQSGPNSGGRPALAAPKHTVILTVTGNIGTRNTKDAAIFDDAMIDALPARSFRTWTPWFKEPVTFSGPLLQTVLDAVGARGQTLHMVALNDYAVEVPIQDARAFGPLLARRINGKVLGVRDKGPMFLIYPFDERPETRNELFYARSIWQITRIAVQ